MLWVANVETDLHPPWKSHWSTLGDDHNCYREAARVGEETPRRVWKGISKTGEEQGEAQAPSATSRPDPLRVPGPEDQYIERSHCP